MLLQEQSGKKDDAVNWIKHNYAKDIASPHDYSLLAMFYEQCDMRAGKLLDVRPWKPNWSRSASRRPTRRPTRRSGWPSWFPARSVNIRRPRSWRRRFSGDFKENPNATTRANSVLKRIEAESAAAKAAEAAKPATPPATAPVAPPTPETKDAPKEAAAPAKDANTAPPPPEKK